MQRFLPRFGEAARIHSASVGTKWRVDELNVRRDGRWTYIERALDQDGQVVDAYFSEWRNAAAARTFVERAITETGVVLQRVDTDNATCYPPALRAVLPMVAHRRSNYVNNGLERDPQHFKQRISSMRGFTRASAAAMLCRGHALIQNLRIGCSTLTAQVPATRRFAAAWPPLALAISRCFPLSDARRSPHYPSTALTAYSRATIPSTTSGCTGSTVKKC